MDKHDNQRQNQSSVLWLKSLKHKTINGKHFSMIEMPSTLSHRQKYTQQS